MNAEPTRQPHDGIGFASTDGDPEARRTGDPLDARTTERVDTRTHDELVTEFIQRLEWDDCDRNLLFQYSEWLDGEGLIVPDTEEPA